MQTGGRARFGRTPNARARRLVSRVLWAGGLAAAGTVACAVTASAAEPDHVAEPSGGLLGSLTSAVDPFTSAVEPIADVAGLLAGETLLTEDLPLTGHLLGDDVLLGDAQLAEIVEQPLTDLTSVVGLETQSAGQAVSTDEREAPAEATDRSFDRSRAAELHEAAPQLAGDDGVLDLVHLLGSVDSLLFSVEGLVPHVTATGGAPVGDPVLSGEPAAQLQFGTLEAPEVLSAVPAVVSLLNLPLLGGSRVLDPFTPLLEPLHAIVRMATPFVAHVDPLFGPADVTGLASPVWHEPSRGVSGPPISLHHVRTMSAAVAPWTSSKGSLAASVDHLGSGPAAADSSLAASQDDQSSPQDSRGNLRPSLLMTPVAGTTALHAGATGAATSADQAGPSSHALLPEQAVLRARLFSAAAYARGTDVKPLREANDPPVSPD